MTLEIIRAVLAWSTVVNLGILLLWFFFFAVAHEGSHRGGQSEIMTDPGLSAPAKV